GHHATDHGGELNQAVLDQVFVLEGHVGGTEVHRLGLDLLEACTRTDRLVVDAHASGLVVGISPLGVHGSGEGSARASHVLGHGSGGGQGESSSHSGTDHVEFHSSPFRGRVTTMLNAADCRHQL